MTSTQLITAAPTTLYWMTSPDYAGFACNARDPFNPGEEPTLWVPLGGGLVTQDDPETGDTISTGITMTAEEVGDALVPATIEAGNMLMDYDTAKAVRPATREEWEASTEQAEKDGGSGVIEVDGRSCYVEGEVWAE